MARWMYGWLIAVILAASQVGAQEPAADLSIHLPNIDGKQVQLSAVEEQKLTVVCFLGTECPLAKLYTSRLNELHESYPEVRVVGICSNQQDSVKELISYREDHQIRFPLVKDRNNRVADRYDAQRTPEVFLLDSKLRVVYRGRIDDQYQPGMSRAEPTREDLRIAIEQSLAGKAVEVANTDPVGCLIGRVKTETGSDSQITFANQVSRLLINHCSECHQEGQVGPMSLTDYDEVVGWADMILEVVDDNRMPPWHADPRYGHFVNERRMTEAEKQMLHDWVKAGTPMGDTQQLPKARKQQIASEWRLPKAPDLVVSMRERAFHIPAEGIVEYQYFVVDPGFKEDKWVTAAEIIPGDRSVVHHSIVFVRPPDGAQFQGIGWLAAYVPGQGTPTYNPKFGRRVPAGSKLVFQQHYTPTGKKATDMTRIGLVFGDEKKIENEVFTLIALDQEFVIPPGNSTFAVDAEFPWLPKEGHLHAFSPHMHYRGKSFQLKAGIDKQSEILLNVPRYDFNWQHIYQLQDPLPLSRMDSLSFTATFDNSKQNPANPDPTQHVTWGDQTWEEMAVAFAIVSVPRKPTGVVAAEPSPEELEAAKQKEEAIDRKANQFADEFIQRFDKNDDGQISVGELPRSTQRFGRWSIDQDNNGLIVRQEVIDAIRLRLRVKQLNSDEED